MVSDLLFYEVASFGDPSIPKDRAYVCSRKAHESYRHGLIVTIAEIVLNSNISPVSGRSNACCELCCSTLLDPGQE